MTSLSHWAIATLNIQLALNQYSKTLIANNSY